jgi:hypothetical protein
VNGLREWSNWLVVHYAFYCWTFTLVGFSFGMTGTVSTSQALTDAFVLMALLWSLQLGSVDTFAR